LTVGPKNQYRSRRHNAKGRGGDSTMSSPKKKEKKTPRREGVCGFVDEHRERGEPKLRCAVRPRMGKRRAGYVHSHPLRGGKISRCGKGKRRGSQPALCPAPLSRKEKRRKEAPALSRRRNEKKRKKDRSPPKRETKKKKRRKKGNESHGRGKKEKRERLYLEAIDRLGKEKEKGERIYVELCGERRREKEKRGGGDVLLYGAEAFANAQEEGKRGNLMSSSVTPPWGKGKGERTTDSNPRTLTGKGGGKEKEKTKGSEEQTFVRCVRCVRPVGREKKKRKGGRPRAAAPPLPWREKKKKKEGDAAFRLIWIAGVEERGGGKRGKKKEWSRSLRSNSHLTGPTREKKKHNKAGSPGILILPQRPTALVEKERKKGRGGSAGTTSIEPSDRTSITKRKKGGERRLLRPFDRGEEGKKKGEPVESAGWNFDYIFCGKKKGKKVWTVLCLYSNVVPADPQKKRKRRKGGRALSALRKEQKRTPVCEHHERVVEGSC